MAEKTTEQPIPFVRPPDDIDSMSDEELDAWCRAVIMTMVERDGE